MKATIKASTTDFGSRVVWLLVALLTVTSAGAITFAVYQRRLRRHPPDQR